MTDDLMFRHTSRRSLDRYGIELSAEEYWGLCYKLGFHDVATEQDCVKLCGAAGGREKWAVWFKGEWIPLVFDPKQARIITILPKTELRPFNKDLPW